jgi:hypothetical protein
MAKRKTYSVEDAHFDTVNEMPLHPFTEPALIKALEELRCVLNGWHTFREQDLQPDDEMMMHGRDVMEALPEVVIAAREAFQRRTREIIAEQRILSKPSAYTE